MGGGGGQKQKGEKEGKKWKKERGKKGERKGKEQKAGVDQHQGTPEEALKTGCSEDTKQIQVLN